MLKENNKSFQIPFIPDFSSVVKEHVTDFAYLYYLMRRKIA